jgi:hypothetical protein
MNENAAARSRSSVVAGEAINQTTATLTKRSRPEQRTDSSDRVILYREMFVRRCKGSDSRSGWAGQA